MIINCIFAVTKLWRLPIRSFALLTWKSCTFNHDDYVEMEHGGDVRSPVLRSWLAWEYRFLSNWLVRRSSTQPRKVDSRKLTTTKSVQVKKHPEGKQNHDAKNAKKVDLINQQLYYRTYNLSYCQMPLLIQLTLSLFSIPKNQFVTRPA